MLPISRPTWRRRCKVKQVPTIDDVQLERWNRRHAEREDLGAVAVVLERNRHLLPTRGDALDLACGRGASALWLAAHGLRVAAWDMSPVAIDRLQRAARERGLQIDSEVRDVVAAPPPPDSFDLLLVSYFLDRTIVPALIEALRPGGLLCYQTFSQVAVTDIGPKTPAFRLADNELLRLFAPLTVRYYREEGLLGDTATGCRDIALLLAEKPLA